MGYANFGCKLAMYHSALKKIIGAFITSPTTAVLCESGQLPLDYVVVLKLENLAGRLIEKGIEANYFVDRANKVLRQLTGHCMPNIAKLTSYSTRPWYDKIPTIDWTLQKLSKHKQQIVQNWAGHVFGRRCH